MTREAQFDADEITLRDHEGNPLGSITGDFECHCEWDDVNELWLLDRAHIGHKTSFKTDDGQTRYRTQYTRIDDKSECAMIIRALGEYVKDMPPPEMAYSDPNDEHRLTYAQVQ